eukprot:SAG31_NODE_155_length_22130_cov_9.540098_25_plen_78_part_00
MLAREMFAATRRMLVLLAAAAVAGPAAASQYIGPLVCSDPSCPFAGDGSGRTPNNTNFHLRDIAITAGPGGYYCKCR